MVTFSCSDPLFSHTSDLQKGTYDPQIPGTNLPVEKLDPYLSNYEDWETYPRDPGIVGTFLEVVCQL